jgi:hypothetical protein
MLDSYGELRSGPGLAEDQLGAFDSGGDGAKSWPHGRRVDENEYV